MDAERWSILDAGSLSLPDAGRIGTKSGRLGSVALREGEPMTARMRLDVIDRSFLLAEIRETPMHVGGLQIFRLPPGAPPHFVTSLFNELGEEHRCPRRRSITGWRAASPER